MGKGWIGLLILCGICVWAGISLFIRHWKKHKHLTEVLKVSDNTNNSALKLSYVQQRETEEQIKKEASCKERCRTWIAAWAACFVIVLFTASMMCSSVKEDVYYLKSQVAYYPTVTPTTDVEAYLLMQEKIKINNAIFDMKAKRAEDGMWYCHGELVDALEPIT